MRRLATALACGTLALVAAGCGDDDEAEDTKGLTTPVPTIPEEDATTPDTATEPAPDPDTTQAPPPANPGSGGSPAPSPPPQQDSPENDQPPPRDSPAERFEEFCEQNPGACG